MPRRLRCLFPGLGDANGDPAGYHFLPGGRGMVSDDTEHTCLIARALIASAGDPAAFERRFARDLKRWLLLVPAGVGLATLRAALKLLVGVPPSRSGVFSAGNGPAMRAALIGVCYGNDPARLRALVRVSTRITHTDPKAEYGALAVALAAHHARQGDLDGECFVRALADLLAPGDPAAAELTRLAGGAADSARRGDTTQAFAAQTLSLPNGVSGYVYHTVPVALHAWFRHPADLRAAVQSVIACGGDTDTTGAITGALVGAGVGRAGIPAALLDNLAEWPRTVAWMERLAERLADIVEKGRPEPPPALPALGLAARNLVFLVVVLFHGLRRLLPPY